MVCPTWGGDTRKTPARRLRLLTDHSERKDCMLGLKLLGRSMCLIQVYSPNSTAQYPDFVEETSDALR